MELHGTLVYASKKQLKPSGSGKLFYEKVEVQKIGESPESYFVYPRPGLEDFLSTLGEQFNIIVFSSKSQPISDAIIDFFDTWKVVQQRFYKNYCSIEGTIVTKDLTRIIPGSLENVIAIEDGNPKFMQHDNTLILPRWDGKNPKDDLLNTIKDVLVLEVQKASKMTDLLLALKQSRSDLLLAREMDSEYNPCEDTLPDILSIKDTDTVISAHETNEGTPKQSVTDFDFGPNSPLKDGQSGTMMKRRNKPNITELQND